VERIVGIDLGTTHSLVAILDAEGPRCLLNALGQPLTPSAVVVEEDGSTLVGQVALSREVLVPERVARFFKRDMGTSRGQVLGESTGSTAPSAPTKLSPVELSSLVLRTLLDDACAALGEPVTQAVVSVPAWFGEAQRRATREAAELAGLTVRRLINEPTAAALAYGLHNLDQEQQVVVLDLGGGTFDVTVLEIIEGVVEVQSTSGDTRLGGEDFTDVLLEHVARRARNQGIDPSPAVVRARLREACEIAKRQLSQLDDVLLTCGGLGGAAPFTLPLHRQQVEALWEPLLERLRLPMHRALLDARVRPEAIDTVLLVGGATRMRCIRELAERAFGRAPRLDLPPDESVALGAAVQAGLVQGHAAVDDLVVTDVCPFTLGVDTATRYGGRLVEGIFSPILHRGTTIPASREEVYTTLADDQPAVRFDLLQGEHAESERNTRLDAIEIPVPRRPAGHVGVRVRFAYDLSGLIEVDVQVMGEETRERRTLEVHAGRMGASEREAAEERLARLRLPARELLPNATAIAEAEALFETLNGRGRARSAVGEALGQFRAALETRDPQVYEPVRERLRALCVGIRRDLE